MKFATAQALRAALARVNAYKGVTVSSAGHCGRLTDSRDTSQKVVIGYFSVPSEEALVLGLWYEIHESSSCTYYGADRNEDWTVTLESRSSAPWTNCHGRVYAPLGDEAALALIATLENLADKAKEIRRATKMLQRGRCNPDQRAIALAALFGIPQP